MLVIGLTGTFRAGKGAVVDFLLSQQNFTHYSVSAFLARELERRRLPIDRDTMRNMATELRRSSGPTHLVDVLYQCACLVEDPFVIIESLRTPYEVLRIKNIRGHHTGYVIGVDADQHTRWRRTITSASVKDSVTFEEFVEQECLEMQGINPSEQNIGEALKLANVVVRNDGSLDELHAQIRERIVPLLTTRA